MIVCKWWKEKGNCYHGGGCEFRHSELPPPQARATSSKVCWDWNLGRPCSRACEACHFLHACQSCRRPCPFGEGRVSCQSCRGSVEAASSAGSPLASLTVASELEVPNTAFVSFLIGKGGSALRCLEVETSCTVVIPRTLPGRDASLASVRRIALRGPSAAAVARAEVAVRQRLHEWNARQPPRAVAEGGAMVDRCNESAMAAAGGPAEPKDAARGVELEDESMLCVVCLDAPKTHLLLPCGHKCVCSGCAPDFAVSAVASADETGWRRVGSAQCPICRHEVRSVAKVWE